MKKSVIDRKTPSRPAPDSVTSVNGIAGVRDRGRPRWAHSTEPGRVARRPELRRSIRLTEYPERAPDRLDCMSLVTYN
jgi:hypothetical protein